MKNLLLFYVAAASLISVLNVQAGIILNGHFEKGINSPDDWNINVWEPDYFEYSNIGVCNTRGVAIQLKRTEPASIFQKFTVETGKDYYLSMMYKFSDFASNINLKIIYSNGEEETVTLAPKNLRWTRFTKTFTAKSDTAEIMVSSSKIDQKLWLDNIVISDKPIIIQNGSFENIKDNVIGSSGENLQEWEYKVISGNISAAQSSNSNTGNNAFVFDAQNSSGSASLEQIVRDILPGNTYKLTGHSVGTSSNLGVLIEFLDVYGNSISEVNPVNQTISTTTNWSEFNLVFSTPAQAAMIKLKLTSSLSNAKLSIDDLALEINN